jgi:hypothetical protein
MRKKDRIIKDLGSLLVNIKKDAKAYGGPMWFRGQSIKDWNLVPTIARQKRPVSEQNLIKRFKQNATLLINPRPEGEYSWLFIMQHHGVATRLLDWTESPLTAIYFAVYENETKDGVLWVLLPVELNKQSNISPDYPNDIPSFEDQALKNYSPSSISSETTSKLFPLAAIAVRNNPRMQSQLSVFTINHRDNSPIENIGKRNHIWRFIIPSRYKKTIKNELKILGIDKFQLFPELSSIGDALRE